METYTIFSKAPIKSLEDIFLHHAIPNALEKVKSPISRQTIIKDIPKLVSDGMKILRNRDKKLYELSYGCILAAFLNGLETQHTHDVCYPEDESYDFLICKNPRGKKPAFEMHRKTIYKHSKIFKIELVEGISEEKLKEAILNKVNKFHDYKGRILLVGVLFNGLNLTKLSQEISQIPQNNFQTIWLLWQTNHPKDSNKFYCFISELIKYKQIFPLFELPIDWLKIKNEVNKSLPCVKPI